MKYKVKEGCTAKQGDWIYNSGAIIELMESEFDNYKDVVEKLEESQEE